MPVLLAIACCSQFLLHPHVLLRHYLLIVKKGEDGDPVRAGGYQFFHLGHEHAKRQSQERLVPVNYIPHYCISVPLIK